MELELCGSKVDWKPDFDEKSKKVKNAYIFEDSDQNSASQSVLFIW